MAAERTRILNRGGMKGAFSMSARVAILSWVFLFGCEAADSEATRPSGLSLLRVEEDFRIDGHAAVLLPVDWLGVAPDGTIAVIQGQDHCVRFFSPSGQDLGCAGRRGEGPGEFMWLARAGWVGDTLWVADTSLDRITLFSTEPRILTTLPPLRGIGPAPGDEGHYAEYLSASPYAVLREGHLLVLGLNPNPAEGEGSSGDRPLLRVSAEGEIQGLVLRVPSNRDGFLRITYDGGSSSLAIPFHPVPRWSVAPDGSRAATLVTDLEGPDSRTFRIRVHAASGEELFNRTYPFVPVPLPERVVDSLVEARIKGASRREIANAYRTELRDQIPSTYPPAGRLVVGSDGRIWVGLRADDRVRPWMILSPEGEPIGQVSLPRRFFLWAAGKTHVWGSETDDLDVESIVRFRLPDAIGKQ
jgi:hypothetical protein